MLVAFRTLIFYMKF